VPRRRTARERFGAQGGATGVVHTRTGRPFLDPALTEVLLDRLRLAMTAAGIFDELDASFVLLDAELLPWSLKAEDLLRNQYASVGAAARSSLPAAVAGLTARDPVGSRRHRPARPHHARAAQREAFTAAYRHYCLADRRDRGHPDRSVPGAGDRRRHLRDTGPLWHLDIADRLVAADATWCAPTRRLLVDAADDRVRRGRHPVVGGAHGGRWRGHGRQAARQPVPARKGLAQPGVKVRGREYLRIIYGPDYTETANLDRLRERNLGHKRSMALREYALGLESLRRAVARRTALAGARTGVRGARDGVRAGGPEVVSPPDLVDPLCRYSISR
jgi:protein phosphatase